MDDEIEKLVRKIVNEAVEREFNKHIVNSVESTIDSHVESNSNGSVVYEEWYCGISKGPYERVEKHSSTYPNMSDYKPFFAKSEDNAREVEDRFLKVTGGKGMEGGPRGGKVEEPPVYVYVFKMNS